MGVLVSDLILKARGIINDRLDDHFVTEDVSDQCDGVNARFKVGNQNILNAAGGAPVDPQMFVNGAPTATTFTAATGVFLVTGGPPVAGALVTIEYFFALMSDDVWLKFAMQGVEFLGQAPTFTTTSQDSQVASILEDAVVRYMASLGADKMSNLSSWYYQANAGNKSFNKNDIANKFGKMAIDQHDKAVKSRDDVYLRNGQREAPAYALGNIPMPSYTPPR